MEFHVWSGMISRCCDPRTKHYERYGGRGISVCERWRNSYEAFIEDMGKRPKGLTLERIDNNGNYEPGNCKWATRREQANNTSANHVLECRGESMTMAQWCDKLGMGRSTLSARVGRGGSVEEALFGKVRQRRPADMRAAIAEIARITGSAGGKTSAANMTPEERSARAKKASAAAAKKREERRLFL